MPHYANVNDVFGQFDARNSDAAMLEDDIRKFCTEDGSRAVEHYSGALQTFSQACKDYGSYAVVHKTSDWVSRRMDDYSNFMKNCDDEIHTMIRDETHEIIGMMSSLREMKALLLKRDEVESSLKTLQTYVHKLKGMESDAKSKFAKHFHNITDPNFKKTMDALWLSLHAHSDQWLGADEPSDSSDSDGEEPALPNEHAPKKRARESQGPSDEGTGF